MKGRIHWMRPFSVPVDPVGGRFYRERMTMDNGRAGYPSLNRSDSWAAVYRSHGVEPPWLLNWKDGTVVPRGEGGQLDIEDARRR